MKKRLLIKICGMKYAENIQEIAKLNPDYLGFIFFEKSPRYFNGSIPILPKHIKKTGVFVNEKLEKISSLTKKYSLNAVQLHGSESPLFCSQLKENQSDVEIIKVFSVGETFSFSELEAFLDCVDYFLFDTQGKNHGGNGITFNWHLLKDYPYKKPFFLSGGIGIEEINAIKLLQNSGLPIYAVDLNSKFEIQPALKEARLLSHFMTEIANSNIE